MSDGAEIRKVLIGEIDQLAHDLSNGDAGNIEKQGRALSYLLRVVRPLVEREVVLESECRERMMEMGKRVELHEINCPAAKLLEKPLEGGSVILAKAASQSLPWLIALGLLGLYIAFK